MASAMLAGCVSVAPSPDNENDNVNAEPPVMRFAAALEGGQMTPPIATEASGSATLTLDPAAHRLTYDIAAAGLTGAVRFAHFHTGPVGENGPVVHDLLTSVTSNSGGAARIEGSWTGMTETEVADLTSGNVYVIIHTLQFIGGEVRGQILLEADGTQEGEADGAP